MLVRLVLALAVLASTLLPRTARALDEGQWQVGFAPQLTAGFDDGVFPGGGGRVDGRYGITDALSAWAAVGSLWWSMHGYTTRATSASAGLMLAYDVVRIVPFVGLGVAVADVHARVVGPSLGGELNAGAEYLLDPKWSLGLQANLQMFGFPESSRGRGTIAIGVRLARSF
jgi:hypothetical protein